MKRVLGIRKGPAWQDNMGIRLLRVSGQFVRDFEIQDDKFDLVPGVTWSHAKLWNRKGLWCHSGSVRKDCGG